MEHEFLLEKLEQLKSQNQAATLTHIELEKLLTHVKNLERCLIDALGWAHVSNKSLAT